MALDPYSPCPGGTGKKLKFCCADLLGELDKAHRMLEGDQAVACLDYVSKLDAAHPGRPCLLSMKADLEIEQRQDEAARKTIDSFRQQHPTNPIALANSAVMAAAAENADEAVDFLQSALEASEQQLTPQVYEAYGVVGQTLLKSMRLLAGRAHFMLQAGLGAEKDTRAMAILMRLSSTDALPTIFKENHRLSPCPEGASWKKPFDAAYRDAERARWRSAERQFSALIPNAASAPAIWRNLGILRSWLGNQAGAAEAWRKYASLDVPLDDAVEAEATVQLLEEDPVGPEIDVVTIEYPISDFDELERKLSADRRISRMNLDLASLGEEGSPPPRGAFWLLDRELPRTGVGLTRNDAPNVVGQFFIFGRETDRPARIEFVVARDGQFETAKQALALVVGELLGTATREEVSSHVSALQQAVSWNWRLPDDTPEEHRKRLLDEQRQAVLLERWPNTPMRVLDNQTPLAAAKNPAYRIRLLAAILNLELAETSSEGQAIFDELRSKLGLPAATTWLPTDERMSNLRVACLHRVDPAALSDRDLLLVYSTAITVGITGAGRKLAKAILARKADFEADSVDSVYRFLVSSSDDLDEALRLLQEGRDAARAASRSLGQWDLDELHLRLDRQELDEAGLLMNKIAREYRSDQRIMEQFSQLLMQLGLIGPDGSLRMPSGAGAPAAVAGPSDTGDLWTPESAQSSGEKSKLWLPGME